MRRVKTIKPRFTPFYERDPRRQQVKVQFVVDRGMLARVGAIEVTGSPGFSKEEIYNIAKIHPGDRVTTARLTRRFSGLRKSIKKRTAWKPR